eukprot:gb/GECG01013469.1/.p1 GENE.gb/GECG01013469.1/~~gb/GECG01013469.1/.p1  ORF type:complete len:948 (+),score=205.36 gb/GECG01013469.1/:1-2844(+)
MSNSDEEEDFLHIKTIHSDDSDDEDASEKAQDKKLESVDAGAKSHYNQADEDDDDEDETLDLSNFTRKPKQKKERKKKTRGQLDDASQEEGEKPSNEMFEDLQGGVSRAGLSMQQKAGRYRGANANKKTFTEYDLLSDLGPETNSQISTADVTIALIQQRREARQKATETSGADEAPNVENSEGHKNEAGKDGDNQKESGSEGEDDEEGENEEEESEEEEEVDDSSSDSGHSATQEPTQASKKLDSSARSAAPQQEIDEGKEIRSLSSSSADKPRKSSINFGDMHLSPQLLKVINHLNYKSPTPIQEKTIPLALEGKDICGSAVTGSGKTAAFLLPVLQRLLWGNRAVPATRVLIVTPTRELASQCHAVAKQLSQFTDIRSARIVGGLSLSSQEQELQSQPDIVICTPGRMIDHLRNTKNVDISDVGVLVLDEADRLLELGFQEEVKELVEYCPTNRQTLLFSATMTDKVDDLAKLSLKNPVRVTADPLYDMAKTLTQEFIRIRKSKEKDREAILLSLLSRSFKSNVIVFCSQKRTAHRLLLILGLSGFNARELHGNLTQRQRLESLELFRQGKIDMLVATDLAARGLDIPNVSAVINFEMPKDMTQYVHRVGRTARAGRTGCSVTLCLERDRLLMKEIVKRAARNVMSRTVPEEVIQYWNQQINDMQPDIEDIIEQENIEKRLRVADMEAKKAENIVNHADEIHSRPVRTWFQSEGEKKSIQERARQIAEEIAQTVSGESNGSSNQQEPAAQHKPTKKEMKILEQAEKNKKPHRLTRKKRRRREAEQALAKEESKAMKMEKQQKAKDDAAKKEGESRTLDSEEAAAQQNRKRVFQEIKALKGQKSEAKQLKRSKNSKKKMEVPSSKNSDSYVGLAELAEPAEVKRKARFTHGGGSGGLERRKTAQSQLTAEERKELENGLQPSKPLRKGGKLGRKSFKSKAKHKRR